MLFLSAWDALILFQPHSYLSFKILLMSESLPQHLDLHPIYHVDFVGLSRKNYVPHHSRHFWGHPYGLQLPLTPCNCSPSHQGRSPQTCLSTQPRPTCLAGWVGEDIRSRLEKIRPLLWRIWNWDEEPASQFRPEWS